MKRPSRQAEAIAHARRVVAICPECGTSCRRISHLVGWDQELYDWPLDQVVTVVIPALGLSTVLRQGIGVADGGRHRCPPTRSPLFEADGPVRLEVVLDREEAAHALALA